MEAGVGGETVQKLPFEAVAPRPRNFLERFLHIPRPALAADALRAILSQEVPAAVSSSRVSQALLAYGLSGRRARHVAVTLWQEALRRFLDDEAISDSEAEYLRDLKQLLALTYTETDRAYAELVHPRFRKALAEVLQDGVLSASERERLDGLQRALRIAPEQRTNLMDEAARPLILNKLAEITADHRLSPDEERALDALAENLGISLRLDERTVAALHRYSLFWNIENGTIPPIAAPINLQKGECCHFYAAARWLEWRRRTTTVGYSSSGISFRIARGMYYRVGASRPHRVTTEGLEEVDSGTLIITNKRIVFDGRRRNGTFRLSSLLGYEVHSDGLSLEKSSGTNPVFLLQGDVELAAVILGALLARV